MQQFRDVDKLELNRVESKSTDPVENIVWEMLTHTPLLTDGVDALVL